MIVLDECDGSESDIGNQSDVNSNFNMDLPKAYESFSSGPNRRKIYMGQEVFRCLSGAVVRPFFW